MKTKIINVNKLSKREIDFINNARINEYGKGSEIDFKKQDFRGVFFFIEDNRTIMASGMIKPIEVEYLGKKYKIYGIGRGLAIKKGQGYGR